MSDSTDFQPMPAVRQKCPACGRTLGRRSRRRGFVERALSAVDVYPFRCLACGHRFLTFRPGVRPLRPPPPDTLARVEVAIPCELGRRDGRAGISDSVEGPLDRAALITNLTVNGAAVATEAVLAADTEVTVTLRPSLQAEPILIEKAVVRWARRGRVGVGFVAMGANETARLRSVLLSAQARRER